MEAEMRPPRLVDDEGGVVAVRHLDEGRDVRARAVRASGLAVSAASRRSGVTLCVMPSSSSMSGVTKVATIPEMASPSMTDECTLRCATSEPPSPVIAMHAVRLPWLDPLVRNHVRLAPHASAARASERSLALSGPMSMPSTIVWTSSSRVFSPK